MPLAFSSSPKAARSRSDIAASQGLKTSST
jgi:hypothetical protein